MSKRVRILGIAGSLRRQSYNLAAVLRRAARGAKSPALSVARPSSPALPSARTLAPPASGAPEAGPARQTEVA
jgi:hypothetical protein